MRRLVIAALMLILGLSCASGALAFKTPAASDQPIHVVADRLEVDNKAQVAEFIGAVKAVQGDVTITADVLKVYYDRDKKATEQKAEPKKAASADQAVGGIADGGGKIRKVVALGHVKITQKDRVAVGQKATYWAGGRKILLEGKATVWRDRNQVSGEKITVFLDQDRSVVHGKPGKRVSVTIVPEGAKKKK